MFFLYLAVQELYIFFEFYNMFVIFVVEYGSFFGDEHYIKGEIIEGKARYIIELASPVVTIHTSLCTLG